MKNLIYIGVGLIIGAIVGVAASFKAAEKKADDKVTETLAKERKAMRENEGKLYEEKEDPRDADEEPEEPTVVDFSEEVREEAVSEEYRPMKPYVLEGMTDEFKEAHSYISDFDEQCVVYDKKRGRVADEDGCEIFDIKGCLGFNNLNRIAEKARVHIVCERDATVFIVHIGQLEEYMEDVDSDEED